MVKNKKHTKTKTKTNIAAVSKLPTPPNLPPKKVKQPTHIVFFHTKSGRFFEVKIYNKEDFESMDKIISNFDYKIGHSFESKEYHVEGHIKTKVILAALSIEAIYMHECRYAHMDNV